jgi:hypothetical protein
MPIYQEASPKEVLGPYPKVWDITAQVHHHHPQANHTPLTTNQDTIPSLPPNPNPNNSKQYTAVVPVVHSPNGHDKDINRVSADPFASHHTMPSPPASTSHAQDDAYADDAMGHGPGSDDAGGHFVGDTGRSEEGARMSFQDEEDYGRQPRVLKVKNINLTLLRFLIVSDVLYFQLGHE